MDINYPTLEPLRELQNDFSILSGLAQHHANANGDGGGDHARAMATFNGYAGVRQMVLISKPVYRSIRLLLPAGGDTICITRDRC